MKRSHYVMVLAVCLTALAGVILITTLTDENNAHLRNISIGAGENEKSETIEFKNLSMYPGDSENYEINVSFQTGGTYTAVMDFEETKDGYLKNYVNATVTSDGEAIFEGTLSELFADPLVFELTPEDDETITISITYEMPDSVGNEAQGASATFDALLTVGREVNE